MPEDSSAVKRQEFEAIKRFLSYREVCWLNYREIIDPKHEISALTLEPIRTAYVEGIWKGIKRAYGYKT